VVGDEQDGERIDRALAALSHEPRSQIQRWIDAGRVTLNGVAVRASRRVTAGDEIEAWPPELVPAEPEAEAIPLAILYEDAELIVIDKPAGLVVHPAPGHRTGTLVNALLHHCGDLQGVGGVLRPGIVHRLDLGTSGVMVAAKTDRSHRDLTEQFHDHLIERIYHAWVRGVPGDDTGRVEDAIGRHPRDRKRMSVRRDSGREARTAWRVAARFPKSGAARLEIRPETGRTHQIRVHLASIGLPILGDPTYGRGRSPLPGVTLPGRPALHAAVLGFRHPATGERLRFEAPWPEDLATLDAQLSDRESRS